MNSLRLTLHSGKEAVIQVDKINYAITYQNDDEEKGELGEWTRIFFDNGHAIDVTQEIDELEKSLDEARI